MVRFECCLARCAHPLSEPRASPIRDASLLVWSSKPSRGTFEWSTEAHAGARAARLVGVENAGKEAVRGLIYSAPMDVSAGLFKLTGRYRTGGDAKAQIQVAMYDHTGWRLWWRGGLVCLGV